MRLLPLQSTRTDTFFPYQTLFLSKQCTLVPVRILPQDFPLLDPVPTATKPANALALHDQAHMSCQRPRAALAQPPARCDRDEVRPGRRQRNQGHRGHALTVKGRSTEKGRGGQRCVSTYRNRWWPLY